MLTATRTNRKQFFTFERYVRAWELGTGLPVALPPGRYRVTGRQSVNGVDYLQLDCGVQVSPQENGLQG